MIVSTTLTGSNADIIGDALASIAPHVDRCIVIDTGAADDTLEVAKRVAGDKLFMREFPWRDDFAAARNFALHAATQVGARWAVTVDTDERLHFDAGFELKREVTKAKARVLLVAAADGSYAKERIFRLPTQIAWKGPTHETVVGLRAGDSAVLPRAWFRELPKDAATARAKFERDAAILADYARAHPEDPRWHYYLGASLHDLDRYVEAIAAFRACASLRGWAEEGAWACYREASCLCALERWADAIDACTRGLAIRPATAELAWLAGWAAYKAGRHVDAIAWSNMAAVNGLYEGAGASYERISFRYLPALYEGPFDVLRSAYEALGDKAAAAASAEAWAAAKAAREQATGSTKSSPS
jgi:tetratricopeptide (TPR) repeat protein